MRDRVYKVGVLALLITLAALWLGSDVIKAAGGRVLADALNCYGTLELTYPSADPASGNELLLSTDNANRPVGLHSTVTTDPVSGTVNRDLIIAFNHKAGGSMVELQDTAEPYADMRIETDYQAALGGSHLLEYNWNYTSDNWVSALRPVDMRIWRPYTGSAVPSSVTVTTNVVTMTTTAAHGFVVGQLVTVAGTPNTWDVVNATIASCPSTVTFTYAKVTGDVGATPVTGTATMSEASGIGVPAGYTLQMFNSDSFTLGNRAGTAKATWEPNTGWDAVKGINVVGQAGTAVTPVPLLTDATAHITNGTTATIPMTATHDLRAGMTVTVAGYDGNNWNNINGTWVINSVSQFRTATAWPYIVITPTTGPTNATQPTTVGTVAGVAKVQLGTAVATGTISTDSVQINGQSVCLASQAPIFQARLTLTSGTPVTTADVTAAGTIYLTPYKGNGIALFDGVRWRLFNLTEISLALTATNAKPYDVFVYDNAGTPTLETLVWTNDTTRATALTTQDGVLVKTGATTRRYVGTFYASDTDKTEDSAAKRFLWNYYNRVDRRMAVLEATATWAGGAGWRQANSAATNQLAFVRGVDEDIVTAEVRVSWVVAAAAATVMSTGIGLDSTTATAAGCLVSYNNNNVAGAQAVNTSTWTGNVSAGYHILTWLEANSAAATWYGYYAGGGTAAFIIQSGITGTIKN